LGGVLALVLGVAGLYLCTSRRRDTEGFDKTLPNFGDDKTRPPRGDVMMGQM